MIILKEGNKGNEVRKLQSILKQLKYNVGPIDGIFGPKTRAALIKFQMDHGLLPTGILDDMTEDVLENYEKGYFNYEVRRNDTLWELAKKFNVSVDRLIMINKIKDPEEIYVGQELVIPYENINIVPTDVKYDSDILEDNIKSLKVLYPFLEVGTIGESVLGQEMYYLRLGKGPNKVGYNATHHAIEWITSTLLMKFTEEFLKAYAEGRDLYGYSTKDIWNNSSIYIVPMVNPDGADLVIDGLKRDNPYYDRLIKWNKGSKNFSGWSANIRGVDLNHNYNASFEEAKMAEEKYGVYGPGPTRYGGPYPESEPETRNMVKFTKERDFRLVLAYHSQGEVIYWKYLNLAPQDARPIGDVFSKLSGYELGETTGITSYGGYKDWFIKDYKRPGYTIEVGLGKNPLPLSQFNKIYEDNIRVLLEASII